MQYQMKKYISSMNYIVSMNITFKMHIEAIVFF